MQRAKLRGEPFPIKLFIYPLASDATERGDYIYYLQRQVQQVADRRVYFMDDNINGGGKFRMISNGLSAIGLESHFFVLTSWLTDVNLFSNSNIDIIFPGQNNLVIELENRADLGRLWNIGVPIPPACPNALN